VRRVPFWKVDETLLVGKLPKSKWYALFVVALAMMAILLIMVLPSVADAKKPNKVGE
jgi:hypothetical protein